MADTCLRVVGNSVHETVPLWGHRRGSKLLESTSTDLHFSRLYGSAFVDVVAQAAPDFRDKLLNSYTSSTQQRR
jgi:hypothetical protein